MKPDNVLTGLDTPPDEPSQLRLWIVVLWALGIAVFAIIASAPGSPLQPPQPSATTPLQGAAQSVGLGDRSLGTLIVLTVLGLAITVGGFLVILSHAERGRVSLKTALALSVVALLITFLLPLLYSRDVYIYAMYGRIIAVHHANPYLVPPDAFPSDPFYGLVGKDWQHSTPVYGPVFIIIAAGVGSVFHTVPGVVLAYRLLSLVAGLLTVFVLAAVARKICPSRAAAAVVFVGLNPVVLYSTVASGHNDTLVALGIVSALALIMSHRNLLATALLTVTLLIKIVVFIPWLIWVTVQVATGPPGKRVHRLMQHLLVSLVVAAPILTPFLRRADPTLGQMALLKDIGATPANWIREIFQGLGGLVSSAGAVGMSDLVRVIAFLLLALAISAVTWSIGRRATAGGVGPGAVGAAWAWALIPFQLLSLVFLPWYIVWVLPLAWLLPREGRRFLVATSVVQMFTLVVVDSELFPRAHNQGAWVALFLVAPLILLLAIEPVGVLVARLRNGVALEAEDLFA
jgi:hypothetical protein